MSLDRVRNSNSNTYPKYTEICFSASLGLLPLPGCRPQHPPVLFHHPSVSSLSPAPVTSTHLSFFSCQACQRCSASSVSASEPSASTKTGRGRRRDRRSRPGPACRSRPSFFSSRTAQLVRRCSGGQGQRMHQKVEHRRAEVEPCIDVHIAVVPFKMMDG